MVEVPPFTASIARKLAGALVMSVVAALLALPVAANAAEKGVMPDLTWGLSESEYAPTQTAIEDLGAKWVRLEFRWNEGEPRKGSYDAGTLAEWDRAVATSQAAGTKIIGMVHRSPGWASGTKDTYMPPANNADYANFMRFIANRYKGQVAAWEIWNEENISRFWPSGPNPTQYVSLLKAGYTAVKAVDPSALVVFGGTANNDYNFIRRSYDAGAKGYFDVMATHPYPDQYSPERPWYYGSSYSIKAFLAYRDVHKVMLDRGDDKPIWFTEMGWSTCTTNTKCVTPAQQADFLTRAYCILERDPYVQVGIWYNLRNNRWDHDADMWETQLGLMKTTFELKPAYAAYKAYGVAPCPAINVPDEPADPTPADPDPTSDPDATASDADPEVPEEPVVEASSIRRHSSTLLRKSRLSSAASVARLRRVHARKFVIFGRVRRAHGGRVTLKLTRVRSSDAATASVKTKSLRVHEDGRFRRVIRLRGSAHWRMHARYDGNATTYPSRSRILKFRT